MDGVQNNNKRLERILFELGCKSKKFDVIPPIIGIIVGDVYGNILMVIEFDSKNRKNYGSLDFYLLCRNKDELHLVSGFFSAFKGFTDQFNLQNLTHLEIHSSNIKIQTHFVFDKYMLIVFLNSNTLLFSPIKEQILEHFKELFQQFDYEFANFNYPKSRAKMHDLELQHRAWLRKLNSNYMKEFKKNYLERHEYVGKFIKDIDKNIVRKVLKDYLNTKEHLSYESKMLIRNVSRDIKNQIADKLFEFVSILILNLIDETEKD